MIRASAKLRALFFLFALMLSSVPLCWPRLPQAAAQDSHRGVGVGQSPAIAKLPAKAKRWALVIGVDDYESGQINRLSGAVKDARALAEALARYAGFPRDQVTLLASDQPDARKPKRNVILRYLTNLNGLVPQDGLLLVAFAGHGIERNGRAFLLPADAQSSENIRLLEQTALSVEDIKHDIRATGVRQVIVILDSCRNDPMSGRGDSDNALGESFIRGFNFDLRNREVDAFVTLHATSRGQRAYEYEAKRQGYFTHVLIEGLKGGGANERGEVTLVNLLSYLEEKVPLYVRRDLGQQQKPYAIVEGYKANELVIAMAESTGQVDAGLRERMTTDNRQSPPTGNDNPSYSTAGKKKPGKILLLITEAVEGELPQGETITRLLSQKMAENNLSVTPGSDLAKDDLAQVKRTLQQMEAGAKKERGLIPFAIVVSGTVSVTQLTPYQGLNVAVADGALKAIDTGSGETLALKGVSGVRGFGNTREQAANNALKNAGDQFADSLVKQILANLR